MSGAKAAHEVRKRLEQRDRLLTAAKAVCWFDWSGNDSDAVAAIERLRTEVEEATESQAK